MHTASAAPAGHLSASPWSHHDDAGHDDASLARLVAACRDVGGLALGDDLARQLESRGTGDVASLARQVVAGELIAFEWRGAMWLPLFQFEADGLGLRPALRPVLAELASHFDGTRLAAWFVEPNAWLDEQRPIDWLDARPAEVLQAARADRFVASC